MPTTANWSFPTSIRFGAGRDAELAEACRASDISRPLFVTDPGIAPLDIAVYRYLLPGPHHYQVTALQRVQRDFDLGPVHHHPSVFDR